MGGRQQPEKGKQIKNSKMAAPEGNQFWKLRSKHGRDKIFATPALMWEVACEYFEWCDANPLMEVDFRGKEAEKVELPKMRAYTMIGLAHYMDVNEVYFNNFEYSLTGKSDQVSKDFNEVIRLIRETVKRQKFEGAAAGFLNANIISRDLGLIDKKEIDQNNTTKQIFKIGNNEIEF